MVEVEVIACKKHRRKVCLGWITIQGEEGPEKQLVAFCPSKGCSLMIAIQEMPVLSNEAWKSYIKKARLGNEQARVV